MSLKSGTYAIINQKSGTALTASEGPDPRAITGSQYDETESQKFDLVDLGGDVYEIRTPRAGEFVGVLGGILPNSEIFAVPTSTRWFIKHVPIFGPNHYNILPLDSPLSVTLANGGSAAPGTPVKLEPLSGADYQAWEFRRLSSD